MYKVPVLGLVLISLLTVPASSAPISDDAACQSKLTTVKELNDENDLGAKIQPVVDDLIGVLERLCESKAYEEAEDVAGAIRGLLATEEPAEGPKKSEQ